MKTIKLTDNQYKLLIRTLKSHIEELDACGCNDLFEGDLKYYTNEELQQMMEYTYSKRYAKKEYIEWKTEYDNGNIEGTWEDYLRNGNGMFSSAPAMWLLKSIKNQK